MGNCNDGDRPAKHVYTGTGAAMQEIAHLTAALAAMQQRAEAAEAERDCARYEWKMLSERTGDSERRLCLAIAAGRRVAEACRRRRAASILAIRVKNADIAELERERDAADSRAASLQARVERCEGALRSVEWVSMSCGTGCPSCGNPPTICGHAENCRLAAALSRPDAETTTNKSGGNDA